MKVVAIICFLTVFAFCTPPQNPIIGIYTQSDTDDEPTNAVFETYIAASYVKFVEMSGAQVVPIFAYSNQTVIADLLPKLNGVLFPGTIFYNSGGGA
jgi:gamma-glutamyl hydrolase